MVELERQEQLSLFSQLRSIRLNVYCDVHRTRYLLIQSILQALSDFVGCGNIQLRVNKDMQVQKNFSADRASPQLVPMSY